MLYFAFRRIIGMFSKAVIMDYFNQRELIHLSAQGNISPFQSSHMLWGRAIRWWIFVAAINPFTIFKIQSQLTQECSLKWETGWWTAMSSLWSGSCGFPEELWLQVKTDCELCVHASESLSNLWSNRQPKPNIKEETDDLCNEST